MVKIDSVTGPPALNNTAAFIISKMVLNLAIQSTANAVNHMIRECVMNFEK